MSIVGPNVGPSSPSGAVLTTDNDERLSSTLPDIIEEAFFLPCTRMHDLMRAWNVDHEHDDDEPFLFPEEMDFKEVELRAGAGNYDVDFLHPDFTFDNFWYLTCRKVVWMGPDIFVEALVADEDITYIFAVRECFEYETLFSVSLDTAKDNKLQVYSRSVTDATTTVCDYVFQLMTRGNTIWTGLSFNVLPSVSTHVLSWFFKNSRSSHGNISFEHYDLSDLPQDYLRVFEVSTSAHHRIELESGTNPNWSQLQLRPSPPFFKTANALLLSIAGAFQFLLLSSLTP